MKLLNLFVRVLAVLGCCLVTTSYGATDTPTKSQRVPPLSELIWDKTDFVTRLPKKTLCYPGLYNSTKGAPSKKELEEALKILGNTPGTEFIMVPKGIDLPKVKKSVKPHYPWELLRGNVSGSASFLVLVGASGKVGALYCFKATEKEFATAGAACLLQWSFTPTEIEGKKVPVMVIIPFEFTVN